MPEKKGQDDGGAERFALTPDGRVTDSVSGKSYSMEEVAQILFSGDQPQDAAAAKVEPAGQVPISRAQHRSQHREVAEPPDPGTR